MVNNSRSKTGTITILFVVFEPSHLNVIFRLLSWNPRSFTIQISTRPHLNIMRFLICDVIALIAPIDMHVEFMALARIRYCTFASRTFRHESVFDTQTKRFETIPIFPHNIFKNHHSFNHCIRDPRLHLPLQVLRPDRLHFESKALSSQPLFPGENSLDTVEQFHIVVDVTIGSGIAFLHLEACTRNVCVCICIIEMLRSRFDVRHFRCCIAFRFDWMQMLILIAGLLEFFHLLCNIS